MMWTLSRYLIQPSASGTMVMMTGLTSGQTDQSETFLLRDFKGVHGTKILKLLEVPEVSHNWQNCNICICAKLII